MCGAGARRRVPAGGEREIGARRRKGAGIAIDFEGRGGDEMGSGDLSPNHERKSNVDVC